MTNEGNFATHDWVAPLDPLSSSKVDDIEAAKRLMEWNEDLREPTILEYLRYYKDDIIKERHIEAAIQLLLKEAEDRAFGLIDYDGRYSKLTRKQMFQLLEYHTSAATKLRAELKGKEE